MKRFNIFNEIALYLGLHASSSTKETLSASFTALVSTLAIMYFSQLTLMQFNADINISSNAFILTSMAATSVLVFSLPHAPLSQPWPILGGHLFSAFIGVVCWKYFGEYLALSAALAVSLSIFTMTLFRCIHPPGGATALGAVLGGDAIHSLGFNYIVTPTLLNCVIIIIAAVSINLPLRWRRYPAHLHLKLALNKNKKGE